MDYLGGIANGLLVVTISSVGLCPVAEGADQVRVNRQGVGEGGYGRIIGSSVQVAHAEHPVTFCLIRLESRVVFEVLDSVVVFFLVVIKHSSFFIGGCQVRIQLKGFAEVLDLLLDRRALQRKVEVLHGILSLHWDGAKPNEC